MCLFVGYFGQLVVRRWVGEIWFDWHADVADEVEEESSSDETERNVLQHLPIVVRRIAVDATHGTHPRNIRCSNNQNLSKVKRFDALNSLFYL